MTRMTVWSPYSCAPRIECGSWCTPASSRCSATASGRKWSLVMSVRVMQSFPPQQFEPLLRCDLRHVQDVGDGPDRVESDVIRLAPLVFVPGDFVAHPEPVVGFQ